MTLLPNATGTSTFWTAVGEGTHHECLDDDNGATSYVKCAGHLRFLELEFANPSVAEEDIASITSLRFLSSGKSAHRTDPSLAAVAYLVPSGNINQAVSYDAHRSDFETINGNARIYSDGVGSTAWTYSDLENLEMKIVKTQTIELYLSYFAMEVKYVSAVTDNATFFGANF
tara:strand:+ start:309 stop:824 length:516 start_codon:yes stop_codon:yes gene_type:complete